MVGAWIAPYCRACHRSKQVHHRMSRSKSERGAPCAAWRPEGTRRGGTISSPRDKHKDRYQRVNTEGVAFSVVRSVKVRGKGRAVRTARPLGSVEEMEATVAGFSPWECPIRRGRW